ncbi:hypothetical protein ACWC5I_04380 [Kitasatospora sp. NPDC001574]|nr:hypothetical protein [Streptomyces sp. BE303]MED7953987.1 hypothetical protein [Streptomyces sp. BE303]
MNAPDGITQWMVHHLWKDTTHQVAVVVLFAVGFVALVRIERGRRSANR